MFYSIIIMFFPFNRSPVIQSVIVTRMLLHYDGMKHPTTPYKSTNASIHQLNERQTMMRLPPRTNKYNTSISNSSTSYPIYRARTVTTYSRMMQTNRFLYPSQQAATANQPNQQATTTTPNSNQINQIQQQHTLMRLRM